MTTIRVLLIGCGVVFAAGGAIGLLNDQSPSQLWGLAVWLGATVVAHDGLLVPVVIGVGALCWRLTRRLPSAVRQVVMTGLLVGGALALVAIPLIVRHPVVSNPTALPQSYRHNLAWLELTVAAVTGLAATVAWLRHRHTSRKPDDDAGAAPSA